MTSQTQDLPIPRGAGWSPWRDPIRDYTAASWSAGVISTYNAAFPSSVLTNNHYLFCTCLFVLNSSSPSETLYTQTLSWGGHWSIVNVPVPASMLVACAAQQAAGNTDNWFAIYDTATGIMYQGQGTTISGTTVSVTAAGAYYPTGAGWWDNVYKGGQPGSCPYIGTASGAEIPMGQIGSTEFKTDTISHALSMAWNNPYIRGTYLPSFIYPATASDGAGSTITCVPQGARLAIDPAISDATILTYTTSAMLPVVHAMQKYGAYIKDSASNVTIEYFSDGNNSSVYPGISSIPFQLIVDHGMFLAKLPSIVPLDNNYMANLITYT